MIYTVTFNPSIDYIATCSDFKLGETNRTTKELMYPGGKGINVSIVLNNLGLENTALGFVGGFTGKEIENLLNAQGIKTDFIEIKDGLSRINVKLRSNEESELNGLGPTIDEESVKKLYLKLDNLKANDYLVLAGSVPSSMSKTIYSDIMKYLEGKNINIIVDATKDLLLNTISYHPFLVKPNIKELGELFNTEILTKDEAITYARKLQDKGARNVIVSMGKDGAVILTENKEIISTNAPEGKLVNSVGSGDSMVAGFICGLSRFNNYEEAFKYAVCTGSASAFSDELATKEKADLLFNNLK